MQKTMAFWARALGIVGLIVILLAIPARSRANRADPDGESYGKKGEAAFAAGRFENAVENFRKAGLLFAKEGEPAAQTDALVKLAEAYRRLGFDGYATKTLEEALPLARAVKNTNKTAAVLNSLGLLYAQGAIALSPEPGTEGQRGAFPFSEPDIVSKKLALQYLAEAFDLATANSNPELLSSILNNRGILYASRDKLDEAMLSFKESIALAKGLENKGMVAAASANYAATAIKRKNYIEAQTYADTAIKLYRGLAAGSEKTSGLLTIGQMYRHLASLMPEKAAHFRQHASDAFMEANAVADQTQDYRTVSYALGYLGQLKEDQKEFDPALHLTRRALFAAQRVNAKELLSTWEWQIGRISNQRGDTENAVAAYRQAALNLQSFKQGMETGCTANSLSYKDSIEPVYKELTDLLLQKASGTKDPQDAKPYLLEARQTVETLKFAEMQDYFKNSCLEERRSNPQTTKALAGDTAIIYMISLQERVELLLTLANGIKRVTIPNPGNAIFRDVKKFRESLVDVSSDEYLVYAKRLYDTLLRPLEPDLQRFKISTLVVIPDNVFRTIPIAALHDGKDFVISKYATTTSLGMKFTEPRSRQNKNNTLLVAGISESIHGYHALPFVATEMSAINSLFEGDLLINKDFSIAQVKEKVEQNKYSILHLASHGEFSGDVNNSFILAWDGNLTIDQIGRLVKVTQYKDEPLDLITLSACKTAVGDDRAVLGLAGVAIRSGALSSLATLWEVDDKTTTELMVDFYRQLKTTSLSKAQALQQAQISTLKQHRHPYFWSPFLLIGNWL